MKSKFDPDEVDHSVLAEIGSGYSTKTEIAARLKMPASTVTSALKRMYLAGKIQRQEIERTHHYTRCLAPAHDPFGLCQKLGAKP